MIQPSLRAVLYLRSPRLAGTMRAWRANAGAGARGFSASGLGEPFSHGTAPARDAHALALGARRSALRLRRTRPAAFAPPWLGVSPWADDDASARLRRLGERCRRRSPVLMASSPGRRHRWSHRHADCAWSSTMRLRRANQR